MIQTEGKTLPEVLNEVFGKLVEQGGRCVDSEGDCVYGALAKHCAIGWLLPEDNLELMEFNGSIGRLNMLPELGPNTEFLHLNEQVLEGVQQAHDAPYHGALLIAVETLKSAFGPIPNLDEWCALRIQQMKEHNNAI